MVHRNAEVAHSMMCFMMHLQEHRLLLHGACRKIRLMRPSQW